MVVGLGKERVREKRSRDEGICGQNDKGTQTMDAIIPGDFSDARSRNV